MINPFDASFFKFMLGFSFILFLSFTVLFFVNKYSGNFDDAIIANTENPIK